MEPSAEIKKKDEAILAGLGYKQELKRAFTPIEVFGIGFSIIGLVPSIASTLLFSIPNGGPVAMIWGWFTCSWFLLLIGLALGEMSSAAPTSGGLYYWTYKYASPKWRNFLSWIVGYSNTIGNMANFASLTWGCAVQLMAAVSIGSDLTFSPTTSQLFGVYVALLVLMGSFASMESKKMARLQNFYMVLNLLLCIAIIVAVPAATPKEFKNSADFTFTGFTNYSGWVNGFAFVLSFLAPLWTMGGFDAPVHISEEASNASTAVPWAIVSSCGVSLVLGWVINIVLALYMGPDVESIIASPIGQPMATILFNSFGKKGTLVMWSVIAAFQFMMGTSYLTACSRQAFAFSRDGGLPFSRYLYRINRYTQTPVNCVWFSVSIGLLLGLLTFAGPGAINATFSLGVVGQYIAYSLPLASRLLGGGATWVPGPFDLGRLGPPIAIIAVLWMAFSIVILVFPATPQVDGHTMNYTVVVAGGWTLLCIAHYFFPKYGGRYWFNGPMANIERLDGGDEGSMEGEKESRSESG